MQIYAPTLCKKPLIYIYQKFCAFCIACKVVLQDPPPQKFNIAFKLDQLKFYFRFLIQK